MLLSLLYFAVRRLVRALTLGSDRDGAARDIEILVLRHQLRVAMPPGFATHRAALAP
jgi:hypothetical protein